MPDNFRTDHIRDQWHLDAGETIYFERELLKVRSTAFEIKYPEFKADLFIPPVSDQPSPGENHYTYQVYGQRGLAKLSAGLAVDAPRVDVYGLEAAPVPIRDMTDAYGWSLQEMRSAMHARKDLPGMKVRAARRAIEHLRNEIMLLGDGSAPYLGLRGLFKLSGVQTYTIGNGALGSKLWTMKTADEIVADMFGIVSQVYSSTNECENPDTLIIPVSRYEMITSRRMGDSNSATILRYFLETMRERRPGFNIETSIHLETAGAASATRMMAYAKDPDKVGRIDPIPFEQMPPQIVGFETVTLCHARTGGVITFFPQSIAYGDGF